MRHSLMIGLAVMAFSASAHAQGGAFVNWESPHIHPLDLTPDGARLLAAAGESSGPMIADANPRPHVIDVAATIVDGRLRLDVLYSETVHDAATAEAIRHFDEALSMAVEDQGLLQVRAFAENFQSQPKDARYYRTVEALPLRPWASR